MACALACTCCLLGEKVLLDPIRPILSSQLVRMCGEARCRDVGTSDYWCPRRRTNSSPPGHMRWDALDPWADERNRPAAVKAHPTQTAS